MQQKRRLKCVAVDEEGIPEFTTEGNRIVVPAGIRIKQVHDDIPGEPDIVVYVVLPDPNVEGRLDHLMYHGMETGLLSPVHRFEAGQEFDIVSFPKGKPLPIIPARYRSL
jgi:hypothetical protein